MRLQADLSLSRSRRPFLCCAIAVGTLLTACARVPAFRVELPAEIERSGETIAIVGDLQLTSGFVRFVRRRENNIVEQRRLIDDLQSYLAELAALVIVGDLVYTARSPRHWAHFDTLIAPFAEQMPVLPAIGNHDYPCYLIQFCRTSVIAGGMLDRFPWFEPGVPYAVDSGSSRMLFLDTESRLEEQGEWLADQLSLAADRHAVALVFFHRPAYSNSRDRGATGNLEVLQHIVPALRAAELPVVVFNGHIHGLEYIVREGVHFVTTGGGGGPRGPMAEQRPFDQYRGPDCIQPQDRGIFRPFNYVLLGVESDRLTLEIRGFCRGDSAVRELDRIEIPL